MSPIVVGTDFSARSDRALRRAVLLARQGDYEILVLHVIDDDRPKRLVEAESREAAGILEDLRQTMATSDAVTCRTRLSFGRVDEQMAGAAREAAADLMLIGPHRRSAFKDFTGTTAERIIRSCPVPLIVAHAVPAAPYRKLLIPTDFDEPARRAARIVRDLSFSATLPATYLHVYDAEAREMMGRAMAPPDDRAAYLHERAEQARTDLGAFLASIGAKEENAAVRESGGSIPDEIVRFANRDGSDLIVLAWSNKGLIEQVLLGSVTEGVLRSGAHDVLVVPAPG